MVDAAIERLANEHLARTRGSVEPEQDAEHELDLALYETPGSHARKPTRLRWKGLDVSDEFRSYAERVARGEDLPPFEGRVLAEPNPAFPWDQAAAIDPPKREGRGSRVVLWCSAAVVLALLGWSIVERLERPALATLEEAPSASTSASASARVPATPHDVVQEDVVQEAAVVEHDVVGTDVVGTDVVQRDVVTTATLAREPQASLDVTDRGAETTATATVPAESAGKPVPSVPSATAPTASAAAPSATPAAAPAAKLAPPGALEHAIGAVFAARAAETGATRPDPAGTKAREDDFGIFPPGDAAPVVPTTTTPTATAAKSVLPVVGNVGDLQRARQLSPGAVRKEPGTESSAKGSLLVEVPSF